MKKKCLFVSIMSGLKEVLEDSKREKSELKADRIDTESDVKHIEKEDNNNNSKLFSKTH